jgi:hypothetical protein
VLCTPRPRTYDRSFGRVTVRIYLVDHRSPHSHVVSPDFQVLVRIPDLVVTAGEARAAQIAEAIAWAEAHRDILALKWP